MNGRKDRPAVWALVGLLLLAVTVAIVLLTSSLPILQSEIIK